MFTHHLRESAFNLTEQSLKLVCLSVLSSVKTENNLRQHFLMKKISSCVIKFIKKPSMSLFWDLVVSAKTFNYLCTISTQDFTVMLIKHSICSTDKAWKIYSDEAMVWEQEWHIFIINIQQIFLHNHMIDACYHELAILCNTYGFLTINQFYHELAVSSCHLVWWPDWHFTEVFLSYLESLFPSRSFSLLSHARC